MATANDPTLPVARPHPLTLEPDSAGVDTSDVLVPAARAIATRAGLPVAPVVPTVLPTSLEAATEAEATEPTERVTLPDAEPETEPSVVNDLLLVPRAIASFVEWCFGLFCVVLGLSFLSALPVLQFFSLGYLLESGGRIARTGRLRDGFIGIRLAARIGGIVLASWCCLLPVRFVADLAHSASIIDPGGSVARGWRIGLFVLIGMTAFHILTAVANGGKLRYFFFPFNFVLVLLKIARGGFYTQSRDAVYDTLLSLRLPYYFWLGLRGFAAAALWLVIPVSVMAMGRIPVAIAPLIAFLGGMMLTVVLVYLPFLQLKLAQTGRFASAFNLLAIRRDYRKAPWMFAFSFVITLLFALPLYLLKIEIVPQEAAWLPGLVFMAFIYPSRLLTGWALGRATRRGDTPRHWFFRWTGRMPFLPAAGFYVLIIFFTQYTSWNGVWSLYEQHAFLLPVPFIGM